MSKICVVGFNNCGASTLAKQIAKANPEVEICEIPIGETLELEVKEENILPRELMKPKKYLSKEYLEKPRSKFHK